MDASEPAGQLADRWTFVWSAPAFALGLMMIVAVAAWWLRSTLCKSVVKDLKAQISIASETAKTLEQRLSIAREQEQTIVAVRKQLEAQIVELQREVLFSPERVRTSATVLADSVTRMKATQSALANTLGQVLTEEGQGHHSTNHIEQRDPPG
jgi:hypothetical protein